MIKKDRKSNEKGITLIALIITIIILIILAAVSLKAVFSDRLLDVATSGVDNYVTAQEEEGEEFNNVDRYIKVATNKKPNIEVLRYSDRTASSMKITAMATDGDGENLTYKLYVGETKENLSEQTDIKEKVEQGTEVSWTVTVKDATSVYYYKVIVSDEYADIDSGIRETNNAPVLGAVTIEKDLDETTGNWVKVKTSATDTESDPITYTFKMWKKEEGVSEEDLIKQEPTKTGTNKDAVSGEPIEITISGLEEYQDYIYRVDVTDNNNIAIGKTAAVKTYCSGKGFECPGKTRMQCMWRNTVFIARPH